MQPVLKIESLMAPVSQQSPSGSNLRYSIVYDQIKEARRSDDQLARGEWQSAFKTADWQQVAKICQHVLIHKSKDLQVGAWLTEALLHLMGFSGLSLGLELIVGLLEDYWETLYPQIEGDDLDYRIGPLVFLNEKISEAVYKVPICDAKNAKGYTYHDWQDSKLVGFEQGLDKEQKNRRQAYIDEGKISAEQFNAAVNAGTIGFYENLTDQLKACKLKLQALDKTVTEYFAPDPPGFSKLAHAVEACLNLVSRITHEKQKSEVRPQEDIEVAPHITHDTNKAITEDLPSGSSFLSIDSLFPTALQAVSDITESERLLWQEADRNLAEGQLKTALDLLMASVCQAPSLRRKNRFLLFAAKLCLKANRPDLSMPIAEKLYGLVEAHHLEQWEHPSWIAEVVETLYRCLNCTGQAESERAGELFEKLCTLNITKAAAYRN